jgi:hypothetical protein
LATAIRLFLLRAVAVVEAEILLPQVEVLLVVVAVVEPHLLPETVVAVRRAAATVAVEPLAAALRLR